MLLSALGRPPLETKVTPFRPLLAIVACAAFLISPVYGATVSGLGTVVYAEHANVGLATASVGSTVFGGDRLITAASGSLQVRARAARFLLSSASTAILLQEETSPAAILTSGSATFSTANANAFALHVFTAVVRPNSNEPTIGQVTVVSRNEMLVKSTRGALACTVDGETRVIPEGETYRVVMTPEGGAPAAASAQGPKGSGGRPLKAGRSKAIYYIAAGTAIVTIFALHESLESPDRP
jgi:hypothetical protein